MNHLIRTIAATTVALVALFAVLGITHSGETKSVPSSPADDTVIFLPYIVGSITPAGSYYCYEYEFGLIWTSEVITLNTDGNSIYNYNPPYAGIVTGTWVYTPSIEEVGFTNFRWLTTTFQAPNRLWASQYLTRAGFEIAISCDRLQ